MVVPKGVLIFVTFLLLLIILLLLCYIHLYLIKPKKNKCNKKRKCYQEHECEEIHCDLHEYRRKCCDEGRYPHWDYENSAIDMATRSTNWAGYVATTNFRTPQSNVATKVSGTFIVPSLQRDVKDLNNNVSAWVGLDGAFASSPSVQQIGIDLSNVNGKTQSYAWFEMYPKPAYQITGFPVNAGDTISVSVQYTNNGIYTMVMSNLTRGKKVTVPTNYTRSTTAKRQCVEWIVEAPYYKGVVPLSHFNPIKFTKCSATINGVTGSINKFTNDNFIMTTAQSVPKATPSSLTADGSGFTVTWQHK